MTITIHEYKITMPKGIIYAKKWTPPTLYSDIPIVLVHDSLGCVNLWKQFPEKLATRLGRVVVAYDRLGFGKSDSRDGLPSVNFIQEEASEYFPYIKNHLKLKKFIALGHSVGGSMAVNIAATDNDCLGVVSISAQAFIEQFTLVIHGKNDEYGSIAFPEFISSGTSGVAEMVIFDDCGHMPHKEKPEEVMQEIVDFIEIHQL
jgi:pimeloyl-ACP methyl ester carboxylesterase